MSEDLQKWVTAREYAELTSLHEKTVRRYGKDGKITTKLIGGMTRYLHPDFSPDDVSKHEKTEADKVQDKIDLIRKNRELALEEAGKTVEDLEQVEEREEALNRRIVELRGREQALSKREERIEATVNTRVAEERHRLMEREAELTERERKARKVIDNRDSILAKAREEAGKIMRIANTQSEITQDSLKRFKQEFGQDIEKAVEEAIYNENHKLLSKWKPVWKSLTKDRDLEPVMNRIVERIDNFLHKGGD